MATSRLSEVVEHLRAAVLRRDGAGLTDGQLLEGFIVNRDEAAFAALVQRHAAMVWGVCRRILHSHHLAEDAFQATFLVLVRKAASIVPRDMVANWLYGVAYQTALKARATAAKRGTRERQVQQMPEPKTADRDLWSDLQPLLDLELSRLPEKYRQPIVLCDLEGKTRKEAARQMGVPEGTAASRLARGRTILARRLARHGLAITAAALTTTLTQNAFAAVPPGAVVSSTIKAASLFAAGQVTAAAISAKAALLTEGVIKAMLISKLKIATAVLVGVSVLGAAATSGILNQTLATTTGPRPAAKAGNSKTDFLWEEKEVNEELAKVALQLLQQSEKYKDNDFKSLHGAWNKIQDCKSCHSVVSGDAAAASKGHPPNESDTEKVKRLEQELAKERSERELLQMEVWILLREIQRQKQGKGN